MRRLAVTFQVVGHCTQVFSIHDNCSLTDQEIVAKIEDGTLVAPATILEKTNLIQEDSGVVIGKVTDAFIDGEYSDFEIELDMTFSGKTP